MADKAEELNLEEAYLYLWAFVNKFQTNFFVDNDFFAL